MQPPNHRGLRPAGNSEWGMRNAEKGHVSRKGATTQGDRFDICFS